VVWKENSSEAFGIIHIIVTARIESGLLVNTQREYKMASVPTQVRRLEVSAYQSIMKALAVTGLTWEREDLIAKLRIELNVSNEDHMKVRENVGGDENVKRLRDAFVQYKLTPPEPPAPKRQKTQKKQQQYYQQQYPGGSDDDEDGYAPPQQQYRQARPPKEPKPPSARMQKQLEKAAVLAKNLDALGVNEYICRRVKRFWPAEGGWFDCIVTDYKEETKEHCLTYDINTENESFEWVKIEELDDREFQVVDAPPVDITTGAFKLRSRPEPPKLPKQVQQALQQGAPAATLAKQAEKASGVETVNAIKDNLDIEEAALAAKLAALDEDSDDDSDDSDDEGEKKKKEEEEAKDGEAGGDDASIDAIVGEEEAAGEGEKNVVDADADAGAAAAPEVAAPEVVDAEVVEPTAEDAEKEEI